jgi:uncharacterized protein (TIGR03086 family)
VLCAALSEPGVLDQAWAMPSGPTPGDQAATVGIIELQQHGWDLARGTGQSADFDPEVAEAALKAAQQLLGQYGRTPGVFGDEVEPPDGAPPEDRVAAYLGREL